MLIDEQARTWECLANRYPRIESKETKFDLARSTFGEWPD